MKKIFEKIRFYGVLGIIRLSRDVLLTKFFMRSATLVRYPFYIRSLGRLHGFKGFVSGPNLVIDVLNGDAHLNVGRNVFANHYLHIGVAESVCIGDDVLIASHVFISDHSHGRYESTFCDTPMTIPNQRSLVTKPVKIGNRVWIGEQACILPGVTIGDGSIIGAGSVVNSDIPPNCIAVGTPARVVKSYSDEHKVWQRV